MVPNGVGLARHDERAERSITYRQTRRWIDWKMLTTIMLTIMMEKPAQVRVRLSESQSCAAVRQSDGELLNIG